MFQRLKGAIDNRIAEEQARQRQAQLAAQGKSPARRRPQNSNAPAQRASPRARDSSATPGEKQPDPADFVIGEDDGFATPVAEKPNPLVKVEKEDGQEKDETTKEEHGEKDEMSGDIAEAKSAETNGTPILPEQPNELPVEVRTKLRKLEKLETRYGELLKAYRAAHARVQTIDPFEASLRENTPLTSINDPAAMVEYLNQVKVKGDMVLEEFKRVSAERDDFKKKFEQSEKDSIELKAEVAELKKKAESATSPPKLDATENRGKEVATDTTVSKDGEKEKTDAETTTKSPSSRIGSFSLFSPKFGADREVRKDAPEDLFSYDSEVPRLEQELQDRTEEVAGLNKQVATLTADLAVARESTSSMVSTLETTTAELNTLRDEKHKFESSRTDLEKRITNLETDIKSGASETDKLNQQLNELLTQKNEAVEEIQKLKEQITEAEKAKADLESKLESQAQHTAIINEKLSQKDETVKDLEDTLATAKLAEREYARQAESEKASERRLATMQGIMDNLRNQLSSAEKTVADLKKEVEVNQEEFANRPSSKAFGFLNERQDPTLQSLKSEHDVVNYLAETYGLRKDISGQSTNKAEATTSTAPVSETANSASGGKKKNKKKKKNGKGAHSAAEEVDPDVPIKVSEDLHDLGDDTPTAPTPAHVTLSALEREVTELRKEIEEKNAGIDRLAKQLKDQEALQEEIETLRDDLLHQGEEHVEARDALKDAQQVRKALQEKVDKLEQELADTKKIVAMNARFEIEHKELNIQFEQLRATSEGLQKANADSEKAYAQLSTQFEEVKMKAESLQKDLSAAENLATGRFRDLSELKEVLSKAQPELQQLRTEVAELRSAKESLKNKEGDLKRLESKHEDLKSEMKGLSKRLGDKDSEIKELRIKVEQETKARNKVENDLSSAQLDARVAENKRKDTSELLEQRQKDLLQSKEEAANLRRKISELGDKVSEQMKEVASLREEVTLKTALHSSSQSLLQSFRDQTHELSMQARESSSRAESLEEELAEAQRMLTERTRESQTMRMLLDQSQTGVEARIREMKERMEAAIEERDRVEDEANVRDRRLMREVEDSRNKMRDAQKQLKALEDERDELETKNRDWRRRREELEEQAQDAKKDVEDVKQAVKGLRDALDESERQIREVEMQKTDLKRQSDETNDRVEKLTRANKNLSEEIRKLQEGAARKGSLRPVGGVGDAGPRSSRTSIDSTRSPAPALAREPSTPRPQTPTTGTTNVGLSQGTVDYVYLKNVLLQFMERKDKTHQRQLVPVLGMLLHFDRKDEEKWMAAISAR